MKIAFIGLGTMGGAMALNLRKGGYDLVVHDIRHEAAARHVEAGCTWAETPKAAVNGAEVVFTSLPGPPEVEAVALADGGLLGAMAPDTTWFDLSTNSPTVMRRLHATFAAEGINVLDAPVSGGPAGANSARLAIWVGGDEEVYQRYEPVLFAFSDKPKYIGAIGAGSVAKLVHNAAGYAIQTALAEVFTLGVKAGVPPLDLWDAVRNGAIGRTRTFDRLVENFLPKQFDPPNFALKLAHKDVTLATELGRETGVPMRITNLVLAEMTEALNRGWGDRDSRVPMLLQEERAGVDIEVPRAEIDAVRQRED